MRKTVNNPSRLIAVLILSIVFTTGNIAFAQKKNAPVKIGTYDSRIVIFAWSRSEYLKEYMTKFARQSDSATKANDTARLKELSVGIMSYQHLLHQMIFSNGSIIMAMNIVKDKLPELAKNEGISMIVSKWELNFSDPSIAIIDVTDQVAKLFNPKENIDKMAADIKKQEPVPLEDLTIEGDMLDLYCKRFGGK